MTLAIQTLPAKAPSQLNRRLQITTKLFSMWRFQSFFVAKVLTSKNTHKSINKDKKNNFCPLQPNKTACLEKSMSHNIKRLGHKSPQIFRTALAGTALVLCALSLSHTAQAQNPIQRSSIQALADKYDLPNTPVIATQSRLVFYRPLETAVAGAASIYINGRYHASLVPGGYSPICLTAGSVELGVRHMDVNSRPNKDGFDSVTRLQTGHGQNQYIRVNHQGGKAALLASVTPEQALQELPSTRLQVHTISRVPEATDCVEAPVAAVALPIPPAPPAPEPIPVSKRQLQLAGDTLFEFNRSDRTGITQQGLRAIDQLMAQIRTEFSRIDGIHIIGHADPIGSASANELLSASRAQTVRDYIAMRSENPGRVTSEGRGERELAVTQCGDRRTPASIACNQPNRRVVIEVTGQQR